MNASTPDRSVVAPFNFSEPLPASAATSVPMRADPSARMNDLRGLVKQLWVPGTFAVGTHGWNSQQIADCFPGYQLLQWLQQRMKLTLHDARSTLRELLSVNYITLAVAVNKAAPDDLDRALFKLALPTAAIPLLPTPNQTASQKRAAAVSAASSIRPVA